MWSTPDDAPVALLRVRDDGSAAAVNRAWCELTGLTTDQSWGPGWLLFLAPVDLGPVLDMIRDAAASDRTVCAELSGGAAPLRCLARRSETAGEVVVAVVPAVPAAVVRSRADRVEPTTPPEVVAVIHELYAVSLGLASCLSLVDGPVGRRVSDAIDRLDLVIRRLRAAVVEERRRSAPGASPVTPRGPGAAPSSSHLPSLAPHVPAQRGG